MKQIKKMFLLSLIIISVGIAASLSLKVSIGVGAYDALAQSISFLTGIKVGTIGMIFNTSCIVGQLILLRKGFKIRHLLQLPLTILIGVVINFFFYEVWGSITIDSYILRVMLLMAALAIVAFALAIMLVLDVVTFPLEGFCMTLSKKTKWNFVFIRQSVDLLCILLVVLLTFGFSLSLTLREGTVIGMLLMGPLIGFFMKMIQPVLRKFDLINEEEREIVTNKDSIEVV
ncbi:hypothetical protein M3175_13205 [Robertmurraya korlensis]|uniref:YczE/YyaS/YitT family protein n=1 Tax=Robertmurraya korlensis TaxID=519977 RepID=UPI002040FF3E|nr:hypothetical protein [Robertmurraya korlensis]MCM3601696.1 hypothetical protein [Robertmurraya korlensis]